MYHGINLRAMYSNTNYRYIQRDMRIQNNEKKMHLMHFHNCDSDPIHLDDPIFPSLRYSLLILFITNYYQPENFHATRRLSFFHASLQPHLHFTLRILRISRREDCAGGRGLQTPAV